ncbi:MAG: hypothetical protein QOG18_2617, partial [Microbacteriaceae bacterium]|nr:hypothetical protein [Microbacteriaceae bacterium]
MQRMHSAPCQSSQPNCGRAGRQTCLPAQGGLPRETKPWRIQTLAVTRMLPFPEDIVHPLNGSAATRFFLTDGRRARGYLAFVAALVVVMGLFTAPPAFAATVTSATFTGVTGTV